MCLGIPGQIKEFSDVHEHLARVEVSGVTRIINVGLLEDEQLETGDWVLIHVGFAMSKIDEAEAALALASLQLLGQSYDEELEAFWSSQLATRDVEPTDAELDKMAALLDDALEAGMLGMSDELAKLRPAA